MFADFNYFHFMAVLVICFAGQQIYESHEKTEIEVARIAHSCAAPASAASAP